MQPVGAALAREQDGSVVELTGVQFAWLPAGEPVIDIEALRISAGERVFLRGPSGSGKSTLLGIILGLVHPTEGDVLIGGRRLGEMTLADRKRFFFFQRSSAAFFAGTVAENMDPGQSHPIAVP